MRVVIAVSCGACGAEVALPVSAAFVSGASGSRALIWICAGCQDLATAALKDADAEGLAAHGVHVLDETSDWRPVHPESAQDGPRLDSDTLIDFHEWLQSEDWNGSFARYAARLHRPDAAVGGDGSARESTAEGD